MPGIATLKEHQLRDQFTDTTRTVRRNLLIAAAAAILLSQPDIGISGFLGLDLSAPKAAPLAVGAVAVVTLYEYLSFITYAYIDHRRWSIDSRAILLNSVAPHFATIEYQTEQMAKHLNNIEGTIAARLPEGIHGIKAEFAQYGDAARAAALELEGYAAELEVLRHQMKSHNRAQLARIYMLDWAVPLLVGGFAIATTFGELGVLAKALAGH